jgi:hypothetical protein
MFTENCKIMEVGVPVAAANNTDSNSDILDMTGFDGVVFIAPIEDSVSGGVATLKAEQDVANADAGMALITGASAAATSAANDDLNGKILVLDVYKPQERYVQGVRVSATQNIAFGTLIAIQYNGRFKPPTEHASIAELVALVAPPL